LSCWKIGQKIFFFSEKFLSKNANFWAEKRPFWANLQAIFSVGNLQLPAHQLFPPTTSLKVKKIEPLW